MTVASTILVCIRDFCGIHVGTTQCLTAEDDLLWIILAHDNDGQRWVVRHPDFDGGVCELARLVGFELDDG